MAKDYLTVSQLTKYVARKFDQDPYLDKVYLTGEISNISRNNPKGHQYFTLKDDQAQISVVMFKSSFQHVKFQPKDGDKVLVIGRVTVYQPRGNYQMIIDHMEPDGIGQLYRLLEETRDKLQAEGLFSLPKKKIPKYPKRIAVVTSPSGAVIHDIMLNVQKRYPIVQLVVYPTVVQGEAASASIVNNLKAADQTGSFDTIIVGRGGGSFEDLFPFNEEAVVRAVVAAQTPIISSVGHETDTSLTDYAADYRASTPTEAAVVATPVMVDELARIQQEKHRLNQAFFNQLNIKQKQVDQLTSSYIFKYPNRLIEQKAQTLDLHKNRMQHLMENQIKQAKQRSAWLTQRMQSLHAQSILERKDQDYQQVLSRFNQSIDRLLREKQVQTGQAIARLDLLSPLGTLARGYSFTTQDDQVIKSVSQIQKKNPARINFHDGYADVEVIKAEKWPREDEE